jgi:hypothetical protein
MIVIIWVNDLIRALSSLSIHFSQLLLCLRMLRMKLPSSMLTIIHQHCLWEGIIILKLLCFHLSFPAIIIATGSSNAWTSYNIYVLLYLRRIVVFLYLLHQNIVLMNCIVQVIQKLSLKMSLSQNFAYLVLFNLILILWSSLRFTSWNYEWHHLKVQIVLFLLIVYVL